MNIFNVIKALHIKSLQKTYCSVDKLQIHFLSCWKQTSRNTTAIEIREALADAPRGENERTGRDPAVIMHRLHIVDTETLQNEQKLIGTNNRVSQDC